MRAPGLKMIMNFAAIIAAEKCKQTLQILNIIIQYIHPVISHNDIHQLLHVSTPRCHHRRGTVTKVYEPTCHSMFCSSCSKRN